MLACLDEAASDFSVYHRVSDIRSLPAASFARLVKLLPVYKGAVYAAIARAQAEAEERDEAEAERLAAELPGVQFERGGGESFEARMARAKVVPAGHAETQIASAMTQAR